MFHQVLPADINNALSKYFNPQLTSKDLTAAEYHNGVSEFDAALRQILDEERQASFTLQGPQGIAAPCGPPGSVSEVGPQGVAGTQEQYGAQGESGTQGVASSQEQRCRSDRVCVLTIINGDFKMEIPFFYFKYEEYQQEINIKYRGFMEKIRDNQNARLAYDYNRSLLWVASKRQFVFSNPPLVLRNRLAEDFLKWMSEFVERISK